MTGTSQQRNLLIVLCLMVAIAAVYWPVLHFGFISYDDPEYVTDNSRIPQGFTLQNLVWALTTRHAANWFPLTWISLMLDYRLFGMWAGGYHLVNVLLHVANTLLLFAVLERMTGAPWRSACVAALFAIHPLHVESVAWVTERKDVLSTFFSILTIWAYVRYAESLNARRARRNAFYGLALLLFTLGLMAKPMGVTLPFVLLLLDYWPLGRTPWVKPASGKNVTPSLPRQLLKEKIPFLALAAASSVVTEWAQGGGGTVVSLTSLPLGVRLANALLAYVRYIGKVFWPTGLAVFYPLDARLSAAAVTAAGVGLVAMTAAVIWRARREAWLVTGWFLYLGTLVPVIGLVQVGSQSMADRYTYVPLVGLCIMLCWSMPYCAMQRPFWKVISGAAVGAVLVVCALLSSVQVGYWKDTETLFRHTLSVTRDNWLAHYCLGVALQEIGRTREEIAEYRQALRIKPDFVEGHNNLGLALWQTGRRTEAVAHWEEALRIEPASAEAHNNLGIALKQLGQLTEAIAHWQQALRINPDFTEAHNNLGAAFMQQGEFGDAIEHFQQALRLEPDDARTHYNLGVVLDQAGRRQEAIRYYEQALRLKPDYAEAHNSLGSALGRLGRLPEAIVHWKQALRVNSEFAEAHNNLGVALAQQGEFEAAIGHYEQALRINPDYAKAHYNLGVALEQTGKLKDAMEHYEQALRIRPDSIETQTRLSRLRSAQ